MVDSTNISWKRKTFAVAISLIIILFISIYLYPSSSPSSIRFSITVEPGLVKTVTNGRLILILTRDAQFEPRRLLASEGPAEKPIGLAMDATVKPSGSTIALTATKMHPVKNLSQIVPATYSIQAVFMHNRDILGLNAQENLTSNVERVFVNPLSDETIHTVIRHVIPEEEAKESALLRYVTLKSKLLTAFHKRPMSIRAGVILPTSFEKEPDRKYPLWVHIGGGNSKANKIEWMMQPHGNYWEIPNFRETWLAENAPQAIFVHLDNEGPYGSPYHVNSENNGPYGDAIVTELIPYIEKTFRGAGSPSSRFLEGRSTGGWSALALQIFYPEFFGGAWAGQPDPVDFRAYMNINIYKDQNAYFDERGSTRSSARSLLGFPTSHVADECELENMIGLGDSYTHSGGTWGAWNAVFGPRRSNGLPAPLWDPETGVIDKNVAKHFEQYDLRLYLSARWKELQPKLFGKLHIWIGDMDTYYLNRAVELLDDFLKQADPPYGGYVEYGRMKDHNWSPKTASDLLQEMQRAAERK